MSCVYKRGKALSMKIGKFISLHTDVLIDFCTNEKKYIQIKDIQLFAQWEKFLQHLRY